jgi:hypothetical protein
VGTGCLKISTSSCVSAYLTTTCWRRRPGGGDDTQKLMCVVGLLQYSYVAWNKHSFVAFPGCDADILVCWAVCFKNLSRDVSNLAPFSSTFFLSARLRNQLLKNTFCLSVRIVVLCITCSSAISVYIYETSCNNCGQPIYCYTESCTMTTFRWLPYNNLTNSLTVCYRAITWVCSVAKWSDGRWL